MAYERSENAWDNFGKFIHQFQPETKTLIWKLERILIKLYWQNVSLLFNQTCLFIYMYISFFSRHAENLMQLDNGRKIPPTGWKCEQCDLTTNLWLNLTDGAILCGRRFFDGTGGNNHAVEYYQKTKYPLAVKLGTITADGAGKCSSTSPNFLLRLFPLLQKEDYDLKIKL